MQEIDESRQQAAMLDSRRLQALFDQGFALHQQGKLADAERIYREVLRRQRDHFGALHLLGVIAVQTHHPKQGAELIERAIELNAAVAAAHSNLGKALLELKRRDSALSSFDRAIALDPDFADAHNNRAHALIDLMRPKEALTSCDKAIALKPDLAIAHNNRGMALTILRRPAEALESYDRAIALMPGFAIAHQNRGVALESLNRLNETFAAYDRAFTLDNDLVGAEGDRLRTKMQRCDWSNFELDCANLIASVRKGKANSVPFQFLAVSSSSADQLRCAKQWAAAKFPTADAPLWQGERYGHDRIHIAYVSPDFRRHAISFLAAGLFECHDKSRFKTTAISLGPDDRSETGKRVMNAFERFIDVDTYSDYEVASLIRELEVDIVVDLAGFTKGSRTNIFALRPAPIAASYLGFAGTMGAPYFDYIIADPIGIPDDQREFFAEKIVFLPHSYLASDNRRAISFRTPTRDECGLPEDAFVFCSFNNSYKIGPKIFELWMRLLRSTPKSVLWLSQSNKTALYNLRSEAAERGVSPQRLIFAPTVEDNADHLARQRLADLFLDTLPYNAHTTASDALWVGLPVLTCLGVTFAGRVAASLLSAIGLPEMITTSLEAYERAAIDLAQNPNKLDRLKSRLAENRLTTPLFNTELLTKHIEAAYTAMYERYRAGLSFDHIYVSR
jgi:protein O-GlcNAc transferase